MFDRCEDAVQEALLAAAAQWPAQGIPDDPRAWLITAACRWLTDQLRSEGARRRREERAASLEVPGDARAPGGEITADRDDSLCCCSCAATPC